MKQPGYVYILTNPSFREDWVKIGKTSRPVNVRSKELDNTAVPLPFEIYATLQTSKYSEVEKLVHKTIDRLTDLRIRQGREFFNVQPQVALDILGDIATTLDDARITLYQNNEPVPEIPAGNPAPPPAPPEQPLRRPRFKFSLAGIDPGDLVTFIPTGRQVRVATDDKVEEDGRLYRLSAYAGTFMPESLRVPSGVYQGPLFFSYHGRKLTELRDERDAAHLNDSGAKTSPSAQEEGED